MQKSNKMLH